MTIFAKLYAAMFAPPSPEQVRASALHRAQLDLLNALQNAEDCELRAAYYRIEADTLNERIARLQSPEPTKPAPALVFGES